MVAHSTADSAVGDQAVAHQPLQYESALPMANGRLAMLLFLSTELMFFTAIIGAYLVLRLPLADQWPTQKLVHVELWIGVLNTVILLASSWALSKSARRAAADDAKGAKSWLLVTILLATAFLSVKGYEYYGKYKHGLYPNAGSPLIYDSADQDYLSETVARVRTITSDLESNVASDQQQARLDELNLIRSGVIEWTQHKAGSSVDPLMRQRAIDVMAHQIKPLRVQPSFDKYLADESSEVVELQSGFQQQLEQTEAELRVAQEKLQELAEFKEGSPEQQEAFADQSKLAEDLTSKLSDLRKEILPLKNRLKVTDLLNEADSGINEEYHIKLPVVLPAGKAWTNTYYLMTGFHLFHLIAGLGVLLFWLCFRLGESRTHWLKNFGLYWYFVDLVWIVIFGIVYWT